MLVILAFTVLQYEFEIKHWNNFLEYQQKASAKPAIQTPSEWNKLDYFFAFMVGLFALVTIIDMVRRGYKFYRVTKAWNKEEEEIKEEQVQAFKELKAKEEQEGTVVEPKLPEQKKND